MEIVTHLILTTRFLVKGRVNTGDRRLTTFLRSYTRPFLPMEDVTLLGLQENQRTLVRSGQLRVEDIVLAHEFLDLSGDEYQRTLAGTEESELKMVDIYLREPRGCELLGMVHPSVVESHEERGFFVVTQPELRGLKHAGQREFEQLQSLSYVTVQRAQIHCLFCHD